MPNASPRTVREAVSLFADRPSFEKAVEGLLGSGFERADLSVLSSHESLDAAGTPGTPWKDALVALVGELKYEGSLVAAGAILLVGGPVASSLAAVIGAATAGIAAKEVLGEVMAKPHTEDFARSLAAGGVILWVRTPDKAAEDRAISVLAQNGGHNIHIHDPGADA
ncbi:MAG: hypothetical protein OEY85_02020 [Rhodospirillales bacterium]|nr:hypothetical protein [Rhodospirillales bacterium]